MITNLDYSMSPTITRPLQPLYRCSTGEPTHFLVEYYSSSMPCSCTWHVQHSNSHPTKLVENGSIVNTDSSSILIIEAITRDLQGIYTFYVQNIYGRAMTKTMLVVKPIETDSNEPSKFVFVFKIKFFFYHQFSFLQIITRSMIRLYKMMI